MINIYYKNNVKFFRELNIKEKPDGTVYVEQVYNYYQPYNLKVVDTKGDVELKILKLKR